jgi:catechol 2,3-dioxygenase-like lactoylglutathione lyase family enzyme
MTAQLNHTIVWCNDKMASSAFLADVLGLPEPKAFGHFMVVELDNGVSLDFMEKEGAVSPQHYAFLIDEQEFDQAFARIKEKGLTYWPDPARSRPNEINHNDGGRGCYFEDPNRHLLEIITRPYGG